MGSVNLVVIVECARTLISHNPDEEVNELHLPSLIAVGAALGLLLLHSINDIVSDAMPYGCF